MSDQTKALLPVTLKPCPFCGFDSQCLTKVTAGAGMFDALQCQHCGATGPYNANYAVHGDGPTRWNTRSQSHSLPGDHAAIADKIIAAVKAGDDCRGRGKFEVMQILAALTPSALSGDAGEGE